MRNFLLFMTLLLVIGIVGCSSGAEGEEKKSDELTVYTAFLEKEAIDIFDKFEEETGIKAKFVRLGASEILARIKTEKNNPQASIWFGGSSDTFIAGANEDLLQAYKPKDVDKLPKDYMDPDNYWTPVAMGAIAFTSNEDWLEENSIEAPQSWDDLLKPEFNENIAIADPASSGTAYTVLATMVQMSGEDQALDYFKEMDKNVLQYSKSGGAPVQMVGLNEAGVGITFSQDIQQAIEEGYPMKMTFPEEGTGYEVTAAAIIKDGPETEKENAEKFIDWVIDNEAQTMLSKFFRIPVNSETEVAEDAVKIDDINVVDYDAVWAGENRDDLLKKFEEAVRNTTD